MQSKKEKYFHSLIAADADGTDDTSHILYLHVFQLESKKIKSYYTYFA
jgi:hypothetical protein